MLVAGSDGSDIGLFLGAIAFSGNRESSKQSAPAEMGYVSQSFGRQGQASAILFGLMQ